MNEAKTSINMKNFVSTGMFILQVKSGKKA